jgi:hypothetical protein
VPEKRKPSETPYLRFGETKRPIMGPAVEIVGNAKALLQLRRQIDRALKDENRYRLDEAIYRDEYEQEHQVVVRRARSREEMRPPVPRVQEAPEKVPWAEVARRKQEEGQVRD